MRVAIPMRRPAPTHEMTTISHVSRPSSSLLSSISETGGTEHAGSCTRKPRDVISISS